jgi:hypothetical protein
MQQAKRADVQDQEPLYQKYINPQWVRLLEVLQMNVEYVRCEGAQLHTADGRHFLDYISGYCVHNAGHNHQDHRGAELPPASGPRRWDSPAVSSISSELSNCYAWPAVLTGGGP